MRTDTRLNLFNELEEAGRAVTPRGDLLRQGRGGRSGQKELDKAVGSTAAPDCAGDLPVPFEAVAASFPSFLVPHQQRRWAGFPAFTLDSERRVFPRRRGIGCCGDYYATTVKNLNNYLAIHSGFLRFLVLHERRMVLGYTRTQGVHRRSVSDGRQASDGVVPRQRRAAAQRRDNGAQLGLRAAETNTCEQMTILNLISRNPL